MSSTFWAFSTLERLLVAPTDRTFRLKWWNAHSGNVSKRNLRKNKKMKVTSRFTGRKLSLFALITHFNLVWMIPRDGSRIFPCQLYRIQFTYQEFQPGLPDGKSCMSMSNMSIRSLLFTQWVISFFGLVFRWDFRWVLNSDWDQRSDQR